MHPSTCHILFAPCLPVLSSCWNEGFDQKGGVQTIATHLQVKNPDACQQLCGANSQCSWWILGRSSSTCWLTNGTVTGLVPNPDRVTGSKQSISCSSMFIHFYVHIFQPIILYTPYLKKFPHFHWDDSNG